MSDLTGYKLWLTNLQRQPVFVNNFWSALLAIGMKDDTNSFQIPYFVVEEELKKEDDNVHLDNKQDAIISNALRHWLVHLLKDNYGDTSIHNYEERLREFLERENVLPRNIARPLTSSTSFHNLPTDCKFWILYTLKTHKKDQVNLKTLTKDPLGNNYYLVPDCRLYVRISKPENVILPIDEEKLKDQPWEPLYRFIHNNPCKLLCENKETWEETSKKLLSLKMSNLYYSLLTEMTIKIAVLGPVLVTRKAERRKFEEDLSKIAPVPVPRTRAVDQKKRTTLADALVMHSESCAIQTELNPVKVEESPKDVLQSPNQTASNPSNPKKRFGKCWQFPQCPFDNNRCPYVHPKLPCTKFPNCPRGWECLFLHAFCENDGYCEEPNCAYEHLVSKTTYYRQERAAEENPRPIAAVAPIVHKVVDQENKEAEQPLRPTASSSTPKKKRCQYFPQCKKSDADCPFFHPTQMCRNLNAERKCPGQWCLFKHGTCTNDGYCTDLKCVYEHVNSLPVFLRKREQKPNEGSLSRATSIRNISTCSEVRVTGRRKSVTFEDELDTKELRKDSTDQKPVGILRSPKARQRCKFGASCRTKNCEYEHVLEKCKAFPNCPNGGVCIFVHDVCEKDGVCSKENCDYKHILPHEIGNKWCTYGSRCTRIGCKFIHPKECTGLCPTPGNCWMYHRPAPAPPRQGYGPGFPPGPGFSPVPPPQFMPPAGIRYGFGPDFTYRLPPPPVPGYGMDQRMGPMFPPQGHFPPGGYDPRYPSGPGGFGQGRNYAPPHPPRPTTPGFSPQYPPQSETSKRERQKSSESNSNETTRF